jgi:hypothetical protein
MIRFTWKSNIIFSQPGIIQLNNESLYHCSMSVYDPSSLDNQTHYEYTDEFLEISSPVTFRRGADRRPHFNHPRYHRTRHTDGDRRRHGQVTRRARCSVPTGTEDPAHRQNYLNVSREWRRSSAGQPRPHCLPVPRRQAAHPQRPQLASSLL